MSHFPIELLKHILEECEYLEKEYKSSSFDELVNSQRLSRAICRSLEIIGEASNKVDQNFKAKYPDIPWREMGDIRNKIIHDYFGIDFDIIYDVIRTDIPQLKIDIEKIIGKHG